ncbi:MAG: hypothetical protein QMD08_06960 [Actinomycetota bacterium]|nr:hypothetical protein [Actinomycetota bacterium]
MESFAIHARRGLEIGSTYASVLMVLNRFGLPLQVKLEEKGYQAIEVVSQYAPFIAKTSVFFMAIILALIYLHLFLSRRWMIDREISKAQVFFRYSTAAILAFTLTFKVFSPQYLIWLCPLIPLVRLQNERQTLKMWLVFLLACILTQVMIFNIWDLINLHLTFMGILIARNLLLWYMLYLLVFKAEDFKVAQGELVVFRNDRESKSVVDGR